MKKNLTFILIPVVVLVVLFWTSAFYAFVPADGATKTNEYQKMMPEESTTGVQTHEIGAINTTLTNNPHKTTNSKTGKSNALKRYALSLLGSPYVYAGMSPSGFDCSGFITYIFDKHNVDLPHSSAMQANEGVQVSKREAQTGDLVIFTGTNPEVREPGHVGMVISAPGDTIEFVHSSSNGGVKISKVEGTRYDLRFLEVRRVL